MTIRGEDHGRAKLSEAQVREIRRVASSKVPGVREQLAKRYGVSPSLIARIVSNKNWSHVR